MDAVTLQRAVVWQKAGDLKRAEEAYQTVLADDPTNTDAMNLLAIIHHERGQRRLAIDLLRAATAIRPDQSRYWSNLGLVLGHTGDTIGAIAALRRACQVGPADHVAHAATIFAMDLHGYASPYVRLLDKQAFNARFCAANTAKAEPLDVDYDADRRLRVGYVSADFRRHSASSVFLPVLRGHSRDNVEMFLYNQGAEPGDSITEECRQLTDTWRDIHMLSDEALAEVVRGDKIDILVDLSGYSGGNRLIAFSHKPAPIQITGWGHVTGTGMPAFDYVVCDERTLPSSSEPHFVERPMRVVGTLPFAVPSNPPAIVSPPRDQNGYVTFGYFGRAQKLNESVLKVWADILHAVPNSRLALKSASWLDSDYCRRVSDFFTSLRIGTGRVDFLRPSDNTSHLSVYGDIDIALDPFPHGGGVTTFEATLMGVPTVSMWSDNFNGRITPSILTELGVAPVAHSQREYFFNACAFANGRTTINTRLRLRDALLSSVLVDAEAYAGYVESAYHEAWRLRCIGQASMREAVAV